MLQGGEYRVMYAQMNSWTELSPYPVHERENWSETFTTRDGSRGVRPARPVNRADKQDNETNAFQDNVLRQRRKTFDSVSFGLQPGDLS